MADKIVLQAQPRSLMGKAVKKLRREGITPVVVYGATEPVSLQVPTKEFVQVMHQAGTTQLISVEVEGESEARNVLIRDLQQHVTRLTPLHADLIQVNMDQVIHAAVPVVAMGESPLVARGEAVYSQVLSEIQVEALPADLPSVIEIDATILETFEDSIVAGDIDLGEKVRVLDDAEALVATVSRLRAAETFDDEIEGEDEEGLEGEELPEGEDAEGASEGGEE